MNHFKLVLSLFISLEYNDSSIVFIVALRVSYEALNRFCNGLYTCIYTITRTQADTQADTRTHEHTNTRTQADTQADRK